MFFCYGPQRSHNKRIDYFIDVINQKIIVTLRTGQEQVCKMYGEYKDTFVEHDQTKITVNLISLEDDLANFPVSSLIESKVKDGEVYLKLMKWYGPEEESDMAIRFPDWNKITTNCYASEAATNTSLNPFQRRCLLWYEQLSEILSQTHNLLYFLDLEYKKHVTDSPPLASPISIRSLKTSILNNGILYGEAIANFVASIIESINQGGNGAPKGRVPIAFERVDELLEKNKPIRLEIKLSKAWKCLSEIFETNIHFDKGCEDWRSFKKLKNIRNDLTHIKLNDKFNSPSMDKMIVPVQITDRDILLIIQSMCWFNKLLNDLIVILEKENFYPMTNLNNYFSKYMVIQAASIAEVPYVKILEKYNFENLAELYLQD